MSYYSGVMHAFDYTPGDPAVTGTIPDFSTISCDGTVTWTYDAEHSFPEDAGIVIVNNDSDPATYTLFTQDSDLAGLTRRFNIYAYTNCPDTC